MPIKVVRRSAEHLSGLIDGLLDISKIEAGRFHLNRNEVRTAEFLDQLVDMFRLQAAAKGIEFRFLRVATHLPVVVHTDENRLRQILINLLSNAIKFTDEGHVTIRVLYRNQVAEFEIEDTGDRHPPKRSRARLPAVRAARTRARQRRPVRVSASPSPSCSTERWAAKSPSQRPRQGQRFRVKLLLSEVLAAAHRLDAGAPRLRLCRSAPDRTHRR